jgi:sugar-specific transcriptional regulator TrmB
MNDKITKFLTDIGLSEKEVLVYLALLPVDGSSVIELSKATSINRTTLYPILEDLVQKRLIVEVKQGKKTVFQAEPPERIETFVQNRKAQLEEQEKVLSDIIPQMRGFVRQTGEKPIVKVYDGREGILNAMDDYYEAIDLENDAYLVYSRDLIESTFSLKELEKIKQKRLNKKIISNVIYSKESGEYTTELSANRFRVDHKKYPILCDIAVYGDRIRFITLKRNLSAIFIKNKDIAETFESLIRLILDMQNEKEKKEKGQA